MRRRNYQTHISLFWNQNENESTVWSGQVYRYPARVSFYTGCILIQRMLDSVSVDESFAVSSGLLNLVIVFGDDII